MISGSAAVILSFAAWAADRLFADLVPRWVFAVLVVLSVSLWIVLILLSLSTRFKDRPASRDEPDPKWLPLQTAPFVLARSPVYGPLARFTPAIIQAALPGSYSENGLRGLRVTSAVSKEASRDKNGFELSSSISWELHSFWLDYTAPKPRKGAWATRLFPWDLDKVDPPKHLTQETWDLVRTSLKVVWDHILVGEVGQLVEKGYVKVWARFGSAQNPFTPIGPDAWKHFEITDIKAGRATGEGNDRLFSIHFEPLPVRVKKDKGPKANPRPS